jgi:FdhD protein
VKEMVDHRSIQYSHYRSGRLEIIDADIVTETPVSLTVNGEVWLTFMCTPNQLEALAVGFLFNEGVVDRADQIADIRLCAQGDNVDVWLHQAAEKPEQWRRTSGCTGGFTAADVTKAEPVNSNGFVIHPDTIGKLIEQLFESQDLYRQVGGVHTSALSDGQQIWAIAEDIGRHNSLDKLAGLCLLERIEMPRKILLTTGRISSEMLQKSARLGAAMVISRTSPSSLSIELAQKWGITLIGYARRDRFNVYAWPERINPDVESAIEQFKAKTNGC